MFSFGSKVKSAEVLAAASAALQAPTNVPFCCPDVAQLRSLPVARLFRLKEGPESDTIFGSVGDDPGSISIFRSHFSTLHDWYCLDVSAQVEVAFRGSSVVTTVRVGRVPVDVLFGTQKLPSSAVVQLKSRLIDPVARPSDLSRRN
jgi:hypothetical protein